MTEVNKQGYSDRTNSDTSSRDDVSEVKVNQNLITYDDVSQVKVKPDFITYLDSTQFSLSNRPRLSRDSRFFITTLAHWSLRRIKERVLEEASPDRIVSMRMLSQMRDHLYNVPRIKSLVSRLQLENWPPTHDLDLGFLTFKRLQETVADVMDRALDDYALDYDDCVESIMILFQVFAMSPASSRKPISASDSQMMFAAGGTSTWDEAWDQSAKMESNPELEHPEAALSEDEVWNQLMDPSPITEDELDNAMRAAIEIGLQEGENLL